MDERTAPESTRQGLFITAKIDLARKAAFNRALVLDALGEKAKAVTDLKYAAEAEDDLVAERARALLVQLEVIS